MLKPRLKSLFAMLFLVMLPQLALGMETESHGHQLDLTEHFVGYAAIAIFVFAYILVMLEEFLHLRKSKPVMLAAGLIWGMIGALYVNHNLPHVAEAAVRHNLLEYAELMLFLLVAMTYINAMDERNVFEALRSWLVKRGYGFRQLFWVTGLLAFFISPIADNLTTALLMCAVVMAVGATNQRFVLLSCINIVIAANAGGAFSPFGDITTLMVWQKVIHTPEGIVDFWSFFHLFIPAAVNWFVPAFVMSLTVPNEKPPADGEETPMKRGAKRIIVLFLLTIITAVSFHNFLSMPPVLGMLTGLSYLQFLGYYLKKTAHKDLGMTQEQYETEIDHDTQLGNPAVFEVFTSIARAEWDTLLFFYGVVLCVGGLGFIGYLTAISSMMYTDWGQALRLSAAMHATPANITVGILSSIIDNIPVMFAVLTMMPDMSTGQWLLVTLTAGVGGSLLSIGSAAGVALMGQARGKYTFFGHLKWTPVILLGYIASIVVHIWLNHHMFV